MTPEPELLKLPQISHALGDLTFFENGLTGLPFDLQRVYFIDGIPPEARRGGHAHRRVYELVIAVRGHFLVELTPRHGAPFKFQLDTPDHGLLVPPDYWRTLSGYAEDSLCLVASSSQYDENEYIRDWDEFTCG